MCFLLSLNSSVDQTLAAPPSTARSPARGSGEGSTMELTEDLVEEIILRLPPVDPASLVRAALVCKPWCGLIASPRFRRRFRAFHRMAPTLGLVCNIREEPGGCVVRFVPTSPVVRQPRADQCKSFACDARHGRVLLCSKIKERADPVLVVWNPMTNARWELPSGPWLWCFWIATVLCAAMGACDHLDCPGGAFLVFLISTLSSWVYSSEAGTWRKHLLTADDFVYSDFSLDVGPTALVGNTLNFSFSLLETIVSYDLESWEPSVIRVPPICSQCDTVVKSSLMTLEDGRLGAAWLDGDARLSIWSMESNANGEKRWTQIRVFELVKLLSVDASSICSDFVGFSHGIGIFSKAANDGLFTIDLNSGHIKKVCEDLRNNSHLDVFSYTTFYTPVLRAVCTEDKPRGCSSARLHASGD